MNVLIIARCRQWLKAQLFPIVVVLIVIGGFVLLNQVLARERREKELLLYFDYALQRRLGLSRDEAFEQYRVKGYPDVRQLLEAARLYGDDLP